MSTALPRLCLAGLSGGSGKTLASLALCRALARRGLAVRPCKKGPDYIDARWLTLAAGHPAVNLDPFLLPAQVLQELFAQRAQGFDVTVIEGNRGIFDGGDAKGSVSTAELARQLDAPTVLVLDATKMTRTAAAVVAGINHFEEDFRLAGVILNRTAGERHRSILRQTIESHTGVPVLGTLPKLGANPIPERHMGLTSDQELPEVDAALDSLAVVAEEWLDIPALLALARHAAPFAAPGLDIWPAPAASVASGARPRIGVVRDAALWFYYPENLEALERAGAELLDLSILSPDPWPALHGLYLGGGFPECFPAQLAANESIRAHLRALSASGLPIYAECGGFMVLAQALDTGSGTFPMAGVLPVTTRLCARPQGLGYVEAQVVADNPFHPQGATLRGHEFHYSCCAGEPPDLQESGAAFCLRLGRGVGMAGTRDGLLVANTFAAYSHIHALGCPWWAPAFVAAARLYREAEDQGTLSPGPLPGE